MPQQSAQWLVRRRESVRPHPQRVVLRVESLEQRETPAAYTVTTTSDAPVAGAMTLRQAIQASEINPGADSIQFAGSLANQTILLQAPLPVIQQQLTITGFVGAKVSISGAGSHRLFDLTSTANVSLYYLTLLNGKADRGGALQNSGRLSADSCEFAGNVATDSGGAIVNYGYLVLRNSYIQSNRAQLGGGVANLGGDVDVVDSIAVSNITDNTGTGKGGFIYSEGSTRLFETEILASYANAGAGIYLASGSLFAANASVEQNETYGLGLGAGLYTSVGASAYLLHCTIAFNRGAGVLNEPQDPGPGTLFSGDTTLVNSIVIANGRDDVLAPTDIGGRVTLSSHHNLVGDPIYAGGMIHGTANNIVGVRVQDVFISDTSEPVLKFNSPAIGRADPLTALSQDLLGSARDRGSPDLGAREVIHPLAPILVPYYAHDMYSPAPSPDVNTAFVKGLYRSTLSRHAEPAGLASWVALLNSGATREYVSQGFVNSLENRSKQVLFMYANFLNRFPDSDGLKFHTDRLLSGVDEGVVMADFILSPEFTGQNDNASFVNTMYYAILGRTSDPSGFNGWMQALASGATSREAVVNGFLRSTEGIGRVVKSYYTSYLKRDGDAGGINLFVDQIARRQITFGQAAAQILGSAEYYNAASYWLNG